MAPADDRMAFLVKGKGPAARGRFALGPAGANIHFSAEPLFRSIGAAGRLGAAPSGSQWFRVTADAGAPPTMRQMGHVVKAVQAAATGRADGARIAAAIKPRLL